MSICGPISLKWLDTERQRDNRHKKTLAHIQKTDKLTCGLTDHEKKKTKKKKTHGLIEWHTDRHTEPTCGQTTDRETGRKDSQRRKVVTCAGSI